MGWEGVGGGYLDYKKKSKKRESEIFFILWRKRVPTPSYWELRCEIA